MKSKIIAIVLLIALVVPTTATFFWLQHEKAILKKEVKHRMMKVTSEEELVLLSFTETEISEKLRWEHSKEFEFEGQMYDIVKRKKEGDRTYYWCWLDAEETELNQKLAELTSDVFGRIPNNRKKQQTLLSFYRTLYVSQPMAWSFTTTVDSKHKIVGTLQLNIQEKNSIPPTPPPQVG